MVDHNVSLAQVGIKTTAQEHFPAVREELLHGEDMGPPGLLSRLCHDEGPEGGPSDGRWKCSQGRGAGIVTRRASGPLPVRHRIVDHCTDIPGLVGQGCQMHGDGRVLLRQTRQQGFADPHPSEAPIGVAAILDEPKAVVHGVGVHVLPPAVDERANHPILPCWCDAAHAADARTAKQSIKDGLCLIVEGVAHGDAVSAKVVSERNQHRIARIPRRALEGIGGRINVDGECVERQPQVGREPARDRDVILRVDAQSMIHARHREPNAEVLGHQRKRVGQRHGVGAAGAGHHNVVTRCEKGALPHAPLERREERCAPVPDQNEPERTGT